jgi:hypothetical protein
MRSDKQVLKVLLDTVLSVFVLTLTQTLSGFAQKPANVPTPVMV